MIDPTPTPLDAKRIVAGLTLQQRAGLLVHPIVVLGDAVDPESVPPWGGPSLRELIVDHGIRFFCLGSTPSPSRLRAALAPLQELARSSGSGLPIVFSTDPRHGFAQTEGAAHAASGLSRWPETLGLGALGDEELVREYGETVRRDYVAMGIRMALHPQVDLATEPRWARQLQTFGADPGTSARLVRAFIEGLQGASIGGDSVAATTKHFPGGGPQRDGEDPHFPYGREQVYPGGRFDDHLEPFRAAIAAGTAAVMPYYGMPVGLELGGRPVEPVGFAFNRRIMHGLLREELGFEGVALSDFGLVTDQTIFGKPFPAKAWGVEHLSRAERLALLINAGNDQVGGEHDVPLLVDLVERGLVDEQRVIEAAERVVSLQLRLHPEPLRDDEQHDLLAPEVVTLGLRAQSRTIAVLENREVGGAPLLPLGGERAVLLEGVDAGALPAGWRSVGIEEAEIAVVRIAAPFEPRDEYFLEAGMHQGSLELPTTEVARILALAARLPVVLVVHLDRPAVLTPVAGAVSALLADFGAEDAALLDALTGAIAPEGRLPFELPSSMEAVREAHSDVPGGSEAPLYPFGWRTTAWR